ncbi:alpha-amylase, partial [Nonlabens dokdonensis]
YFTSRGFNDQHLVAYAESHDEQRLMYKNLQFGNSSNASHNVRDLAVALDRQEAIAAILYSIPGPKMIWQFGELGYEIDIDQNGRTGRKPIPWTLGYDTDANRLDLYDITATMINFKTLYPETFNNTNNNLDLSGLVKRINLDGPQFDAVVVANFDVTAQNVNPNFSQTGTWYDYFNNNSVMNVTNTTAPINLQPGEYKVFTTQQLNDPLSNEEAGYQSQMIRLFPNPATSSFRLSKEVESVKIYNISGQLVKSFNRSKDNYEITELTQGIYFVQLWNGDNMQVEKLIKS